MPVSDGNSAVWQGVVPITPGTATTPLRGLVFYCTASGAMTMTLADGSSMTFPIAASTSLETLDFAVAQIALSGGAAGTFWGLK